MSESCLRGLSQVQVEFLLASLVLILTKHAIIRLFHTSLRELCCLYACSFYLWFPFKICGAVLTEIRIQMDESCEIGYSVLGLIEAIFLLAVVFKLDKFLGKLLGVEGQFINRMNEFFRQNHAQPALVPVNPMTLMHLSRG